MLPRVFEFFLAAGPFPHTRRITHGRHIVDRDREPFGKLGRLLGAADPASGPFPVVGDQHHRHRGDVSLRLRVGLNAATALAKLFQVSQLVAGYSVRGTRFRSTLEPSHDRTAPLPTQQQTLFAASVAGRASLLADVEGPPIGQLPAARVRLEMAGTHGVDNSATRADGHGWTYAAILAE